MCSVIGFITLGCRSHKLQEQIVQTRVLFLRKEYLCKLFKQAYSHYTYRQMRYQFHAEK